MFDSIIQHQSGIDPETTDLRPLPVIDTIRADVFCAGCGGYIETVDPNDPADPIDECPTAWCQGPDTALSTVARPYCITSTPTTRSTDRSTEATKVLTTYWNHLLRRGVRRDDPVLADPFGGDRDWADVLTNFPWESSLEWLTKHLGRYFVTEAWRLGLNWEPYNPLFHPTHPRCPIRETNIDPADVQMHHWSYETADPDREPPNDWDRVTPMCDQCHATISMEKPLTEQKQLAVKRQRNEDDWNLLVAANLIRRYSLHHERPVTHDLCRTIQQRFNITVNVETLVACYEDEHPECDGSHDVTTDDVQKHSTTDDTLLILCDECGCREVDRVEFEAHHPEIDESFIERLGPGAERLRETTDWDTHRVD